MSALKVTRYFHHNRVDLCSIINAKSGRCSEDCAFCAQSGHYRTGVSTYPLLPKEEILERAREMESRGARRFSLFNSRKISPVLFLIRERNSVIIELALSGIWG